MPQRTQKSLNFRPEVRGSVVQKGEVEMMVGLGGWLADRDANYGGGSVFSVQPVIKGQWFGLMVGSEDRW
jgi:hypothetical protein